MPSQYKNFLPISLLFHLGKSAENIAINKMRNTLSNIIDPSQFAYQNKVGTVDALIQLLDDYTSELDKPSVKFMQLAGIDFSKAFDGLQPPILIDKICNYGFNKNITKLVANLRKPLQKYLHKYMIAPWVVSTVALFLNVLTYLRRSTILNVTKPITPNS